MTEILFIHGFNGSPTGGSYTLLKERLDPEKYHLHTIDYNPADPVGTIRNIRGFCIENHVGLVIGTSLGGFFALCVTNLPRIVHNVCWSPSTELLRLGLPEQYARIYKVLEDEFLTRRQEGALVRAVFSTGDELLGDRYRAAFENLFTRPALVGGGHRMNEAAADIIVSRLIPELLGR